MELVSHYLDLHKFDPSVRIQKPPEYEHGRIIIDTFSTEIPIYGRLLSTSSSKRGSVIMGVGRESMYVHAPDQHVAEMSIVFPNNDAFNKFFARMMGTPTVIVQVGRVELRNAFMSSYHVNLNGEGLPITVDAQFHFESYLEG
jgi:hypothetical protein